MRIHHFWPALDWAWYVRTQDAGGFYDHVVPPFEGVPDPEHPCHVSPVCSNTRQPLQQPPPCVRPVSTTGNPHHNMIYRGVSESLLAPSAMHEWHQRHEAGCEIRLQAARHAVGCDAHLT